MLQRAHSPQRLDLSSSTSLVGAERKSRRRGCGVSERTTIKWNHFLTFRSFPAASCRELQWSLQHFHEISGLDYSDMEVFHHKQHCHQGATKGKAPSGWT